jgi:ACS family glucarate transporter-like MFS transporter
LKKRTTVLILLVALGMLTFLDRLSIAVAGPRMQDDLGISPERWGWVLGAFVLAYGIFEIPTGALGDRKGQRSVLTRIVLWWSAFTALTGAARNFVQLIVVRFLFGTGEAGAYPNASGVIARWFPPGEWARAQGAVWAASRFGGALAPLLIVPVQVALGWRASFWIFGAVGILWAAVWSRWYHDRPSEQPGITAKELQEISAATPTDPHAAVPWRLILGARQMWLIVAMYWCYAWASWFYFSWFPTYLERGAGFTEKEMGIFSALPFLLGTAGNVAGGFASDRLTKRFGRRVGRNALACASLTTSALLIVGMALAHNKGAIVILSSLGFGVLDLMLPATWALCIDVGGKRAGVVTGIMNTSGQFGGFVCSVAFGYIVQATGSYNAPLWIIAGMLIISVALFWRINPNRPLIEE